MKTPFPDLLVLVLSLTLSVVSAFAPTPAAIRNVLKKTPLAPLACDAIRPSVANPMGGVDERRARLPPTSMSATAAAADCPCSIVGAGRIGVALADMGKAAGFEDTIVTRQVQIVVGCFRLYNNRAKWQLCYLTSRCRWLQWGEHFGRRQRTNLRLHPQRRS